MNKNERIELVGLPPRKLEVALLVLSGLSNIEIAHKLFVAEKTVKFHITQIYKACGVKSRGQLLAKYVTAQMDDSAYAELQRLRRQVAELQRILGEKIQQMESRGTRSESPNLPAGSHYSLEHDEILGERK